MNTSDSLIDFSLKSYAKNSDIYKQTEFSKSIEKTTLFIVNQKFKMNAQQGFSIMKNQDYKSINILSDSVLMLEYPKDDYAYKRIVPLTLKKAQLSAYKKYLMPLKQKVK